MVIAMQREVIILLNTSQTPNHEDFNAALNDDHYINPLKRNILIDKWVER